VASFTGAALGLIEASRKVKARGGGGGKPSGQERGGAGTLVGVNKSSFYTMDRGQGRGIVDVKRAGSFTEGSLLLAVRGRMETARSKKKIRIKYIGSPRMKKASSYYDRKQQPQM